VKYGYGRGYYGGGQMAPEPERRRGGWIKYVVIAGVGAAIWFMWPRKKTAELGQAPDALPPSPVPPYAQLPTPPPAMAQVLPGTPVQQALPVAVDLSRGYPNQQAYEDAVVASARHLRDAGAQVVLAPHLQHLAPRLGS
jgi:hypothetical protein